MIEIAGEDGGGFIAYDLLEMGFIINLII